MDWTEISGVSLRYELAGVGTETVVFVHELGGSLESWDETLPAFQSNFRTLRYDQRGFGLSEKVAGSLTLDDMLADLSGLLDAVAIRERCYLVGSALGAGIAAAFAEILSSVVYGDLIRRRFPDEQFAALQYHF